MIDTTALFNTAMGWWYWFGVWIALIFSIVMIWWSFYDAYQYGKRTGHMSKRLTLPSISILGLLLQLPALLLTLASGGDGSLSTGLAILGICGVIIVGITMIMFFYQPTSNDNASRTASGVTHSRTSDTEDTASVSSSEDRHATRRAHVIRTNPGSFATPPTPENGTASAQPASHPTDRTSKTKPTSAASKTEGATLQATADKDATVIDDEPEDMAKSPSPAAASDNKTGRTRAYEMTSDKTVIDEEDENA
ncbi:MAG: hypothetical protein FWF45_06120 [Coriobacteriia bacterium]|nr:hypothetical protein [Coriobacteriia bacterium]